MALKKQSFSKPQLAIFILVFGIIGIIIFRTFATGTGYSLTSTLADGSTISGTVDWSVSISPQPQSVEFYIDGVKDTTIDITSPYSYKNTTNSLDTTKLSNASHTIKTTAYDVSGNTNSASVVVTISNTTPPITKKCDINNDTRLDSKDLSILLANYNKPVPLNTKGDCNGDSRVDTKDLFILLGGWGK